MIIHNVLGGIYSRTMQTYIPPPKQRNNRTKSRANIHHEVKQNILIEFYI